MALMSKCGLITRDVRTQKMKIKLYLEPDGSIKGDGLCDYIKVSEEAYLLLSEAQQLVTLARFAYHHDFIADKSRIFSALVNIWINF